MAKRTIPAIHVVVHATIYGAEIEIPDEVEKLGDDVVKQYILQSKYAVNAARCDRLESSDVVSVEAVDLD
jgi:hypothetical protein